MNLKLDLPPETQRILEGVFGDDLDRAAQEALLIEAYRRAKLSIGRLADALGTSVNNTYGFLEQHGVAVNYSFEDFQEDCTSLKEKPGVGL